MKITIDTKEDSHDEIKRVIKMLQSMVGHSYDRDISSSHNVDMFAQNNSSDYSSPSSGRSSEPFSPSAPSSGGLFSMFGSPPSSSSVSDDDDDTTEEEKEKPGSRPQIIMY